MNKKNFNPLKEIGFLTARTHRTLLNTLNQRLIQNELDITAEQGFIIINLFLQDGIPQQELSDKIFKEKSSTKRLIDSLERKDLIVRIPDQNDKRNKLIYLTHGGKEVSTQLIKIIFKLLMDAQENIDKNEMEICKKVLIQIFNNLSGNNEK